MEYRPTESGANDGVGTGLVLEVLTLVNRTEVLESNLLTSPDVLSGALEVTTILNPTSAAEGYNPHLRRKNARREVSIFVHQDVYLPTGWANRLKRQIAAREALGCQWGVVGVWGVASDGCFHGRVWCSGSGHEFSGPEGVELPRRVDAVDEIVIVVNPEAELQFDEAMRGFHLYATDISRLAERRGFDTFVVDAPVVHNSRRNPQVFDADYFSAYRYLQRKYAAGLPMLTSTVPVTKWGLPLVHQWSRNEFRRRFLRQPAHDRVSVPALVAEKLGYESASREGAEGRR